MSEGNGSNGLDERVELEMRILKYREMLRQVTDDETAERLIKMIDDVKRKLREIDGDV
jgi:hypothetical protein